MSQIDREKEWANATEKEIASLKARLNKITRPQWTPPPNLPPKHLIEKYTMNYRIPVNYWYFNDTQPNAKGCIITKKDYEHAFSLIEAGIFPYYGQTPLMFCEAFEKYPVTDKTVLVYGLIECNCDALSLWGGAKRVFAVDYNKPRSEHEKVSCFSTDEWAQAGIRVDIAISFSSFEHDGLGRYGDPLNPDGDLCAMALAKEYVTPGGLLFLGVPTGNDCCTWNAHRIYGALRMPLLLRGWECLDTYNYQRKADATILPEKTGESFQPLLILRNITSDQNLKKNLQERLKYAEDLVSKKAPGTIDGRLLAQIIRWQLYDLDVSL